MALRAPKGSIWTDRGWWAVCAAFLLNGLFFGAWASRIPAFKTAFALEPGVLGLLLLALAGGAIVSFPLAGALMEKWGAETLTRLSALLGAPALMALSLAPSPLTLGLALLLFGAFTGVLDLAMNGWGSKVEASLNRALMPAFHAMFSLGAGIGAGSGYVAASFDVAPLVHFAVLGLLASAPALWLIYRVPQAPPAPTTSKRAPVFALPTPILFLIGLIGFGAAMGEGAMADWSAVFLHDVINATEAQAALGYAIFNILMVVTRLAGGVIIEWLGPVRTAQISAVSALMGSLIVVGSEVLWLAYIGFGFMGIGYAVIVPLVFSRAANDLDTPPGPALASVATLTYGGMLLGPPLLGFVAQLTGLRLSFLILAGLSLMAVFLAPSLRSERESGA